MNAVLVQVSRQTCYRDMLCLVLSAFAIAALVDRCHGGAERASCSCICCHESPSLS